MGACRSGGCRRAQVGVRWQRVRAEHSGATVSDSMSGSIGRPPQFFRAARGGAAVAARLAGCHALHAPACVLRSASAAQPGSGRMASDLANPV